MSFAEELHRTLIYPRMGISYIKGDISMGIFYMPFLSLNLLLSQKWSRKNDPAAEDSIFEPQKQFQCW
jgi:hypothetical protein